MKKVDILIIGAGIGGLALADKLQSMSLDFCIIEKNQLPGGLISEIEIENILIPQGPRIFLKSKASDLISLAKRYHVPFNFITHPLTKYLFDGKKLKPFGLTQLLAYPKWIHLFLKPVVQHEESIGQFFQSRIGHKFVEEIVNPMCAGIWAQNPYELSMDELLPKIKSKRFFQKKQKGYVVFPKGLSRLCQSIAQSMHERAIFDAECFKIESHDQTHIVTTKQGQIKANIIIFAMNFEDIVKLIKQSNQFLDPYLESMHSSSIDVVNLYFDQKLKRPHGSGYLVPEIKGMKTRGVLFDADLFAYQKPDVFSCFVQNSLEPIHDALKDLETVFGKIPQPKHVFRQNYKNKIFSCRPGFGEKLKDLEGELRKKRILLHGAFPKVGVCDVLDKTTQTLDTLTSLLANI